MEGKAERLTSAAGRGGGPTCRRSAGLALLAAAVILGGCGGSKAPVVARVGATSSSSASTNASGAAAGSSSPSTQAQAQSGALKYAECMRANGLPAFPDPKGGGGFEFQSGSGIDPSSPLFKAAQGRCQKLLPGGLPGFGSTTHPSAQALAQMVQVARCMRRHGVPAFPDPTTSVPFGPPAGGGVISDRDGVIFVFPSSLDMQSPLFLRAAAACGFKLTNH